MGVSEFQILSKVSSRSALIPWKELLFGVNEFQTFAVLCFVFHSPLPVQQHATRLQSVQG